MIILNTLNEFIQSNTSILIILSIVLIIFVTILTIILLKKKSKNYKTHTPSNTLNTPFETEENKDENIKKTIINDLTDKNILVVEDNSINAMFVKKAVEKLNGSATIAYNGKEACNAFESSTVNYYYAIIMDIHMPIMDGLTACKSIRQMNRSDSQSIKIIGLSADAEKQDIYRSISAGMNSHILKPIDTIDLLNALS